MSTFHSSSNLCQIRNDSIIVYTHNDGSYTKRNNYNPQNSSYTTEDIYDQGINDAYEFGIKDIEKKQANTYTGTQTYGTKKRQRRATDLLMQCTKSEKVYNPILGRLVDHRISMVTLTLSDNTRFISATECRKTCLRPFLDWLTITKGAKFYIWKAERQKDRDFRGKLKLSKGQLHYHIITDLFVDWTEVKKKWNYLQEKAGYLVDFKSTYNHINPNSTDIHEMQKINNLGAYLLKYVCKEAEKREDETAEEFAERVSVDGKIWDCSSNLRGKQFFKTEFTNTHKTNLDYLVATKQVRIHTSDYCVMYFFNIRKPWCILNEAEKIKYSQFRKDIIEGVIDDDEGLDGSSCDIGNRLLDIIALKVAVPKYERPIKVRRIRRRFSREVEQTQIASNSMLVAADYR
jgi:hypothetical protein